MEQIVEANGNYLFSFHDLRPVAQRRFTYAFFAPPDDSMNRAVTVIAFATICVGTVVASIPRPLTLEEKIQNADLIILGAANTFIDKSTATKSDTVGLRSVHINMKEIIWPPTFTNRSEIRFRCYIWDHTNTLGVFFLAKSKKPERGQWDLLSYNNDWMEPATNALAVILSVKRQKGELASAGQLRIPNVPFPPTTRYDHNPKVRWEYLISFRDGYFDAFAMKRGLFMFGPTNEVDKAKVIGYQDGQLAGDDARSEWMHKLHLLLRSNAIPP